MGMPVVTVASGGIPVVDVTSSSPNLGMAITEAPTGTAVTKVGSGGVAVTYLASTRVVTFSASDKTNVTLSNGSLTATSTVTTGGVRGSYGFTSGKYYWEYTLPTWSAALPGIALASASLTTGSTGAAGTTKTSGIVVNGTVPGPSLGITGGPIGLAVDFGAKLIWFRTLPAGNWNGSGTANPATGAGGVDISSISTGPLYPSWTGANNAEVITANFGATAFSGTVPSGFNPANS